MATLLAELLSTRSVAGHVPVDKHYKDLYRLRPGLRFLILKGRSATDIVHFAIRGKKKQCLNKNIIIRAGQMDQEGNCFCS